MQNNSSQLVNISLKQNRNCQAMGDLLEIAQLFQIEQNEKWEWILINT